VPYFQRLRDPLADVRARFYASDRARELNGTREATSLSSPTHYAGSCRGSFGSIQCARLRLQGRQRPSLESVSPDFDTPKHVI